MKFSISSVAQVNDLLQEGEQVEAEVIRVEEHGKRKYTPIFRFSSQDGKTKEYGNDLFYGDLYSKGDKVKYVFHSKSPEYGRPKTFIRFYGVLILSIFSCLFCLSFIVFNSLKLLSISHVNNRLYGVVIWTTFLMASLILGVLSNFEINRTSNLLDGGIETKAEVIRIDKKTRRGKKSSSFPIFSFVDSNGLNREVRQNWSGLGNLKIGDSVAVIYNPKYSTIARRNSFWYIYGTSIFFMFLFLGFSFSTLYSFKNLWKEK